MIDCRLANSFSILLVACLTIVPDLRIGVHAVNAYRLPSHVKPLNYRLELEPKIGSKSVLGSLVATIATSQAVSSIELNANGIEISGTPSLSGRPAVNVTHNQRTQTVTLAFADPVPPGIWELSAAFKSRINEALSGVFTASVPSGTSEPPEIFVASHFEPTDARKAFPCWDEPALKATFDLTLIVPADKTALSNTPMVSRKALGSSKKVAVQFDRTPRMSTYLLAFVVGRFDQPLETVDSNGVRIRVYTPIGRRSEAEFALGIANRTLPHFVKLFGENYPLAKMDLVSLPDFPSIAMENWGLVLTHEPSLLVSKDTPISQRAFIAVTVIHELAHQWFGNLVTPAWWSDLWLNEGFATWLSFYSADEILPGFNSRDQFIREEKLAAMRDDALEASHPIEAKVQRPEDAAELFDSISYGKGAALVGMLHDWLGDERFFAGLRRYVRQHRFANANPHDLWRALQSEAEDADAEPTIAQVMQDWITRQGFPVIRVSVEREDSDDRRSSGCVLRLRQSRYRLPGADRLRDRWLWRIPFVAVTQDGDVIRRVMTRSSMTVQLPSCGWVMLNPNASGYYRTAYSCRTRSRLLREASRGRIGAAGRLTLLDDVFAMYAADRAWAEDPMQAVHALRRDDSRDVWANMLNHLYDIGRAISSRDRVAKNNWMRYIRGLCSRQLNAKTDGQWRSVFTRCLDYAEDYRVAEWAAQAFPRWLDGTRAQDVPPDLWDMTCSVAAGSGLNVQNFWLTLSALKSAKSVARRASIISCLGAFADEDHPEIENRLIALALGGELQATEVLQLVDGFSAQLVWRLLTQHWSVIAHRFEGPYMLKRLIDGLVFQTAAGARRIKRFFQRHTAIGVRDAVRRQVERVTLTAERIGKDHVEMRFLAERLLKTWSD